MMLRSAVDLVALAAELEVLEYVVDGTGILMANGQFNQMSHAGPMVRAALAELEFIRERAALYVMANIVEPGASSGIHRDPIPPTGKGERWHLPVTTNKDAWFWQNGRPTHMGKGFWHGPVEYWEPHGVWNEGKEDRLHLIVDLEGR